MTRLLADIGGTNTRCAILAEPDGPPVRAHSFANAGHTGPGALLRAYIDALPAALHPSSGTFAVAAPIHNGQARMINIDWTLNVTGLREELDLETVELLNDFEALAYALPSLGEDDLATTGGGTSQPGAPKIVLGPGTGLGVATLVHVGGAWHAIAGEGGHVTLAAADKREESVIRAARDRLGHCSAERLVSGPGLTLLHECLHGEPEVEANELGRRADHDDGAAAETFEYFFRLLGTVASNTAVTVGAFGGVYIGGGIVPRYVQRFRASGFRERFENKGRYREYMAGIPTAVIVSRNPALTGLAARAHRAPQR